MKTNILSLLFVPLLAYFSLSPAAQSVSPPPDGCYPAFTTAEGCNALLGLGSGQGNTGVGWYSLFSVGGGNFNTGVGAGALVLNSADSNTAMGAAALLLTTSGTENTAVGTDAMIYNDSGSQNTAVGAFALYNNNGGPNTANGVQALYSNTNGSDNVAIGQAALYSNTHGIGNVANGNNALSMNVSGFDNTAMGDAAGLNITGTLNICIGAFVVGQSGENNTIRIGDNLPTAAGESACYIGGIASQTVSAGGTSCYVDNNGKLGVLLSARRYKENIQRMNDASAVLYSLKPVTFRYRPEFDKSGTPQFGLVAEEVAEVSPELVTHDSTGRLCTVRYEAVNAMLLNEFLKEHKIVQEQGVIIARLEKQLESVTTGLEKVSAELELRKFAPQTVLNNR